eukprot:scaffold2003_cov139-Cylindrotheca_fusiformis.AAC.14
MSATTFEVNEGRSYSALEKIVLVILQGGSHIEIRGDAMDAKLPRLFDSSENSDGAGEAPPHQIVCGGLVAVVKYSGLLRCNGMTDDGVSATFQYGDTGGVNAIVWNELELCIIEFRKTVCERRRKRWAVLQIAVRFRDRVSKRSEALLISESVTTTHVSPS